MVNLSVIVPCYDVQAYVGDTLAGLARNTGPGVEFLLVDDGSTDSTPALLAEGAARLPGARVLTHTVNRGLSAARNTGLAAARGRWLTFLDGDDVLAPGSVAALLAAAERLGCDFLRTDHVQVTGRSRVVHRVAHAPRGVACPARAGIGAADRRSSVDSPYAWSGIYHRRLLDAGLLRFDEGLRTCEDRPWIWRLHLHAGSFAAVGLRGVRYRRDVSASLSRAAHERQLDFVPAFERIIADVAATDERLLPKALRSYCGVLCHHLDQLDRYPAALRPRLTAVLVRSLAGLPAEPLRQVVDELDPVRAATVTDLLHRPVEAVVA